MGLRFDLRDYNGLNIVCDIIDMSWDDNSIDVVLRTEAFEHLKNPILALKEFSWFLVLQGILILTEPIFSLTHMAPYLYYNGFSEYWYKEHLEDYGFGINELVSNGNFFKYMCQELFRAGDMAKRYCDEKLTSDEISTICDSMKIMMRLARKDRGSEETLCFGKMLVATKL